MAELRGLIEADGGEGFLWEGGMRLIILRLRMSLRAEFLLPLVVVVD